MVSANNSASEQAAHIQDLIVKGTNAIVILAASDTALNGVIRDACNAGIVVVVMASLVTESCVYTVDYNWSAMGRVEIDYIAERLKGNGTLLEIRGIAGDATDKNISDGIRKAAGDYPGLKFAKTVYGIGRLPWHARRWRWRCRRCPALMPSRLKGATVMARPWRSRRRGALADHRDGEPPG